MTDPITALRDVPVPPVDFDAAATHARIDALARRSAAAVARRCWPSPPPPRRPRPSSSPRAARRRRRVPSPRRPRRCCATCRRARRRAGSRSGSAAGEYAFTRVIQRDADQPQAGARAALLGGRRRQGPRGRDPRRQEAARHRPRARRIRGSRTCRPPRSSPSCRPTRPRCAARMKALAQRTRVPGRRLRRPRVTTCSAATQMVTDRRATPPEVLRAIFAFLSGQPGIRLIGDVVDPLGRPGQGGGRRRRPRPPRRHRRRADRRPRTRASRWPSSTTRTATSTARGSS